ncbi:40S ribosomal protein [Conglomerata obtusa]
MEQNQDTKPRKFVERAAPEWHPKTKLGHLVKQGLIDATKIFQFSLKIKEPEIVDHLFGTTLKEEVLVIKSVQKQTKAGQRTRIKAVVAIGDGQGYIGLGVKAAKEAATAIRGAVAKAKCSIRPVKLGWWGDQFGERHTVPVKATGKCGSVILRVIPAPRGSGIVAGSVVKRIFMLAGVKDVFTSSKGNTATNENFVKSAVLALDNSSNFYTPDLWTKPEVVQNPWMEFSSILTEIEKKLVIE